MSRRINTHCAYRLGGGTESLKTAPNQNNGRLLKIIKNWANFLAKLLKKNLKNVQKT